MLYPAELRARKQRSAVTKNSEYLSQLQLSRCYRLRRRWWSRRREHRHRLHNVEPGATQQLMDHRLRESAGAVFDPHRLFLFVELHAAHAVDLAHLRHGEGS